MSLERILQALDAEAEHQITEIEDATQIELEQIYAQAQAEAAVIRQKHLETSRATLQIERTRQLNHAKQQALQAVMSVRENLLTQALEATVHRLTALAASELYPAYLRQLTQEAVDHLGGDGHSCLHVRRQDVELMHRIVQELGLTATVVGDLTPEGITSTWSDEDLGGVVTTTADGRIHLANTLMTRLQRVATLSRRQIAEILFAPAEET